MIEPDRETIIPLSLCSRHPLLKQGRRAGRPIHRSTLERWRTRGVGGIVLESTKIGGVRVTSEQALRRFLDRVSDPKATPDCPTPSQAAAAHAEAEAELELAGI